MNQYLTKKFAKKIIIGGAITAGIGLVLTFVTLLSSYNQAGKCVSSSPCHEGLTWQVGTVHVTTLIYAGGFYLALVGVAIWLFAHSRKK